MEPTERNIKAWEERHRRRPEKASGLADAVRRRLPPLAGKHVLHLGSDGAGESAELVRLGAFVTAVDEAGTRKSPIAWIQAPASELPVELRRRRFHVVYSGPGVLEGVTDLAAFAAGMTGALRKNGLLLLHDEHPVQACLDELQHWRDDYFGEGAWTIGQLVTAVADAGLGVESLEELPSAHPWQRRDERIPAEFLLAARRVV